MSAGFFCLSFILAASVYGAPDIVQRDYAALIRDLANENNA